MTAAALNNDALMVGVSGKSDKLRIYLLPSDARDVVGIQITQCVFSCLLSRAN